MAQRKQIANAAIYLSFSLGGSALGFVTVVFLTRLLPPFEYGRVGLFFSILYFITPIVSLSCDGLIAVNKATLPRERFERFQRTCVGMAVVCCMICEVAAIGLKLAGALDDWLLILAPAFALVRLMSTMAGTEYVAEQRALVYGAITLLNSAVGLGLTLLTLRFLGGSASYRVFSIMAADLLVLAVRYRGRFHILLRPLLRTEFTGQVLHFGIPSAIAVAGGWALNEADKVVVASLRGMTILGIYSAAAALASIMLTFNQSLTNALYPGLFRKLDAGDRALSQILPAYVVGFTLLSAAFATLGILIYAWFAEYVLPARYLSARQIFFALMLSGIAIGFYRPFGLIADFRRLARTRAVAVVVGGLVTLSIEYVGIRYHSLLWAPAGIATGYVVAAFVLLAGIAYSGPQR